MSERVEHVVKLFFLGVFVILYIVLFYLSIIRPMIGPKLKQDKRDYPWYSKENSTRKENPRDTIYLIIRNEIDEAR